MPAAIDPITKQRVIAQYLQGVSRDKIAADNGIGTGTVSNIIDEWKKGVQDSDYESIRELSVFCKKQGITLNALASCIRLNNYLQSLGANANVNGVSLILVLIRIKSSVGEEARVKDRIGPSGSSLVPRSTTAYCPGV